MRKIAFLLGSLLIASSAFAGTASSLDANSLTRAINNAHTINSSGKSFAMVYGGEDISRSNGVTGTALG